MKKKGVLVSIIMAEYNTNQTLLEESIKSIIEQTYKNFELILIDDCGINNVKAIADSFNDERIKVYKNEKNSGLVYSLNKALKLSKGKYIARMDTDDFSYKTRLEKQVEFMEVNQNVDIISSNCDFYDGNIIWGSTNNSGCLTKKHLLNGATLVHPTVMFKKKVMDELGGYLDYHRCEDYATWIELFSRNYNFYMLEDKLLRYHLSKDDYKKRTLKTRKVFFKMLKYQYVKLNPSIVQKIIIYIKTILAGLIPGKIMFLIHKRKFSAFLNKQNL